MMALVARVVIFLAMEAFLMWRLYLGITRQKFEMWDEAGPSSFITRTHHPFRYWSWAILLCLAAIFIGAEFFRLLTSHAS